MSIEKECEYLTGFGSKGERLSRVWRMVRAEQARNSDIARTLGVSQSRAGQLRARAEFIVSQWDGVTPYEFAGLPSRVINCLRAEGIRGKQDLEHLLETSPNEVKEFRNLGRKGFDLLCSWVGRPELMRGKPQKVGMVPETERIRSYISFLESRGFVVSSHDNHGETLQ